MQNQIDNPLVSIILPVYNAEQYVSEAISSVLNQTFKEFELIVIDDHSTDSSIIEIAKFTDPRIRFIKNEQNLGVIKTLNKGLMLARGKYIGRIDADDIWSSADKLAQQVTLMTDFPEIVIVGTWATAIDESGTALFPMQYPANDLEIRSRILSENLFIHPSVIFDKARAIKSGGFSMDEKYVEDFGLWLRIGQFGKFANIPKSLMKYRIHGGGVSQANAINQIKNSLALTKKHRGVYGGYLKGYIKWNTKFFLLKFFGQNFFNIIKKLKKS